MPNHLYSGYVFNDDGTPINGAVVHLYARNDTATSLANTTTDANGYWAISYATAGRYDIEITSGDSKRRIKYDDSVQLTTMEAGTVSVRGYEGQPAVLYMIADDGDDAGDEWKINVADGGVLTLGNDNASAGTYVAHLTMTPHATITSSSATFPGILDVNGSVDWDVTEVKVDSSGDIDLVSTNDAAAAIYLRENAGTSGTIKIHADQGTSVTEGAESINILSDAGGVGIRSTANLANAVNITVDGGTTSTITIFNDQGTTATEGSASIQLLSDIGGINVKSGLNGANAILLTADGGTSETIVIHADQGTGTGSIELLSDVGGIELDAGTDIILDAGGADIFLKDDGTLFGTLTNSSGELVIKSSSSGTTAATFSGANVTLAGTVGSGAITSTGIIKTDDTTEATSATDGSLQTDGGLSVAKDAIIGDDLKLLSDSAVFAMGAGSDFTITHDGSTAATIDIGGSGGSITNIGASGNDWTANDIALAGTGNNHRNLIITSTGAYNAKLGLYLEASGTAQSIIEFKQGDGGGTANNHRYIMGYDGTEGYFKLLSLDTDGSATASDVFRVYDGNGDMRAHDDWVDDYFDYVCDGCHKHSQVAFDCCGIVSWHDDVLALRQMGTDPSVMQRMVDMGIMVNDDDWKGISLQGAHHFSWSAIWQNRERMDAQYNAVDERLQRIEKAIGV